jgi:hypothetical protein
MIYYTAKKYSAVPVKKPPPSNIQPSRVTTINTEDPPQLVIATCTNNPPPQIHNISRIERKRRNIFTMLPTTKHTVSTIGGTDV